MRVKVKGHTRGGKKVKGYSYTRAGTKSRKRFSASARRALAKSRTSKSGHKPWRERLKDAKPGLWANFHAKRHRQKRK